MVVEILHVAVVDQEGFFVVVEVKVRHVGLAVFYYLLVGGTSVLERTVVHRRQGALETAEGVWTKDLCQHVFQTKDIIMPRIIVLPFPMQYQKKIKTDVHKICSSSSFSEECV